MTTDATAGAARRTSKAVAADWLLALGFLTLLLWLELHSPAYTDFEAEAEPAVQALLRGEWHLAIELMPIYGASLLVEAPFAFIAKGLGGGDIAVYRAMAIAGMLGIATLAVLASRWLHNAGRERKIQLFTIGLISASPSIALSWVYGHHEEALVAAVAAWGIIVATGCNRRAWIIGGLLVGAAAAMKQSAVLAIPVAMVAALGVRAAITVGVSAAISGLAVFGPLLVMRAEYIQAHMVAAGGDGLFKVGNLFWFLGAENPDYLPPVHGAYTGGETIGIRYSRFPPDWLATHAHEAIVVLGVLLAAAWWWRHRNWAAGHAATGWALRGPLLGSVLMLFAAAVWWRALIDPWYQAYYLTPGLLALGLSEAARGRPPVVTAIASAGIWLTWGEYAPVRNFTPDQLSAVSLAWMVPFGIWLTAQALRGPRAQVTRPPAGGAQLVAGGEPPVDAAETRA